MPELDDEVTARNRDLLASMFDPAGSYGRACIAHIADGVRFRLIGDTLWSGAFQNKHAWAEHVFMALPRELVGPITLAASHILVEGDHACVRARGTALVRNEAASEPAPGSVRQWDASLVPDTRSGHHCAITPARQYLPIMLVAIL